MLPNGLVVVLDRAVGERLAPERFAALVVGVLREDVVLAFGRAYPSPSPGHVYPRARRRIRALFAGALAEREPLAADVALGRALHVLIDMACPVHAQAVWHYLRDPFERYVDAHAAELAALPVPPPPADDDPVALVDSLAGAARAVRADGRQTPWGKLLRRRQPPLPRAELAEQAATLIPLAAAHARALVDRFDARPGAAAAARRSAAGLVAGSW
jgi:hypothetical protein